MRVRGEGRGDRGEGEEERGKGHFKVSSYVE